MNQQTAVTDMRVERWPMLFESFRLSISVPCLVLAIAGTIFSAMTWKVSGWICLQPDDPVDRVFHLDVSTWPGMARRESTTQPAVPVAWLDPMGIQIFRTSENRFVPVDPVWGVPRHLMIPFRKLFDRSNSWNSTFYYLLGGAAQLAIWSFLGGAIARQASVYLTVRHRISVREAAEFARKHWLNFFGAPALPIAGVSMMALPLVVLGWLMRLDAGVAIAGVGWVFVVTLSLLMAILAIGLCFGWPLMWGTISTEDSDSLDAISRCYAYTYQRPLHYLIYAMAAAVVGMLGWYVAWIFTESIIQLGYWGISWGAGAKRVNEILQAMHASETSGSLWFGTTLISLFQGFVRASASAFSFSYFWCVVTGIYLLLRFDADQTPLDEIAWMNQEHRDFPLPELEQDAAGVPGVNPT